MFFDKVDPFMNEPGQILQFGRPTGVVDGGVSSIAIGRAETVAARGLVESRGSQVPELLMQSVRRFPQGETRGAIFVGSVDLHSCAVHII